MHKPLVVYGENMESPRAGKHAHIGQKAMFSFGDLSNIGICSEWVSLQGVGKVRYYKYCGFRSGDICIAPASLARWG